MYEVKFKWQGDIAVEQDRMIEWYVARGKSCTAAFVTDGTGITDVDSLLEAHELERDLGITVTSVVRVEDAEQVTA
jgi:hypothetical protein